MEPQSSDFDDADSNSSAELEELDESS